MPSLASVIYGLTSYLLIIHSMKGKELMHNRLKSYVCGGQIYKIAALDAVQIAEKLL